MTGSKPGQIQPDFHHFQSEMCRQAGFFNGGETSLRPVYFVKPVLALTFP